LSVYVTNPVKVKGIRMYCGIKNAERCSTEPVGEYICVRYTYKDLSTRLKLTSKKKKANSPEL
jgi:hypothetical protein